MIENKNSFVDVVLPLSLDGQFTYHIDNESFSNIKIGMRVAVSFGSSKIYAAVVVRKHHEKPSFSRTKAVLSVLDSKPIVNNYQMQFYNWLADYYLSYVGEVYRLALPAGFFLQSDTFIHAKKDLVLSEIGQKITDEEYLVLEALDQKQSLVLKEINNILDKTKTMPIVKSLFEKGLINLEEKAVEKYKPKIVKYIKIKINLKDNSLGKALAALKNSPKQREAFLGLISYSAKNSDTKIRLKDFCEELNTSTTITKELEKKGLFEVYEIEKNRIENSNLIKDTSVIGTGYLKDLDSVKENSKVALVLVSNTKRRQEIISQIVNHKKGDKTFILQRNLNEALQLQKILSENRAIRIGVFNPKYSNNEKVDFWNRVLENKLDVIIGTRSSIFLPFQKLDNIIVDNEHDPIFKQSFQSPSFNARDASVFLGNQQKAKVFLLSGTPSAESFNNAQTTKYQFLNCNQDGFSNKASVLEFIDLNKTKKEKNTKGNFSEKLLEEIKKTLSLNKKVIVFKDRRGYSSHLECDTCNHVTYCPNCDVTLTYHSQKYELKCHYCGHRQAAYNKCPSCSDVNINTKGVGTQQIETQLKSIFPEVKIQRIDADTMKRKVAEDKIKDLLENDEIELLVGTRLVLNDWDSDTIGLVVILKADELLHFPDFRSTERAFQILYQAKELGSQLNAKVLIQTNQIENSIFSYLKNDDYSGFIKSVLNNRNAFTYPPSVKIIQLDFSHKDQLKVDKAAVLLGNLLKSGIESNYILGPEKPPLERINNKYFRQILIKIPLEQSTGKIKQFVKEKINKLRTVSSYNRVIVKVNVDP